MTVFTLFFTVFSHFGRFEPFWAEHRFNGSLGLGYGSIWSQEMTVFLVFLVKLWQKRHCVSRLLHFYFKKLRKWPFWPILLQTAAKWLGTNGHFSLFQNGSQFFLGREKHFHQNWHFRVFYKTVSKTAKTLSHPVLNTVKKDKTDTVLTPLLDPSKSR